MEQKYFHTETQEEIRQGEIDRLKSSGLEYEPQLYQVFSAVGLKHLPTVRFERVILYKGSQILALMMEEGATSRENFCHARTMIPGRLAKFREPQEKGVPVSTVKPITDATERKELESIVKGHGFTGEVNFW